VTAAKLRKLQHSPWYYRQRRFLRNHDIALMVNTTQHPKIRFFNQDVRFEVVYKRFTINEQHLFIPIEDYAKYYIDYKMRMAACVAEMLGVWLLRYRYNEAVQESTEAGLQAGYGNANVEANQTQTEHANRVHSDVKIYDKGVCDYLFVSPEEFEQQLKSINCYFIDSTTYDSDYDLRNLVRARLVGNLTDYALKYEIAYMSQFELKIAALMYGAFGATLKHQSRRKLCVTLDIQFYRMEDLITTDNMNIRDNRCLQLILRGPSPPAYYQSRIPNVTAPVLTPAAGQSEMIYNFIERHLLERYSALDRDDDNSYLAYYMFLKIADRALLASYIQGIKSLDDLSSDGFLAASLRSTVFAALLSFDDDGYYKLQQIYVNILRQSRGLESVRVKCFDLRCSSPDCNSPLRYLKRVFCYIMRAFNNENKDTPLTVSLETNERFAKVMYYIAANIIVIPEYQTFAQYISIRLMPFVTGQDDFELNEDNIDPRLMYRSEGVRDVYHSMESVNA
jgi:hypothetical protein